MLLRNWGLLCGVLVSLVKEQTQEEEERKKTMASLNSHMTDKQPHGNFRESEEICPELPEKLVKLRYVTKKEMRKGGGEESLQCTKQGLSLSKEDRKVMFFFPYL